VLVLDDVHELRSRPALATLSHLLLGSPAQLTVFLSLGPTAVALRPHARRGSLPPAARRRLAFTLDEMSELFAQHDLVLAPDEVERLWTRTAGWAAGARLAALALASHADRDGVVDNIVRTEAVIADYLLHEVLDGQPPEVRRFLVRTSMAQPLTEDLARELSGDDDAARGSNGSNAAGSS